MNVVIVAYDLHDDDDERRGELRDAIKRSFVHVFEHTESSVYLVGTNHTSVYVRDQLRAFTEKGDRLFVGVVDASAWSGLGELRAWISRVRSA
jgi:hypothetical protein